MLGPLDFSETNRTADYPENPVAVTGDKGAKKMTDENAAPKRKFVELDPAWRALSPRSHSEAADEQDRAAGGREVRRMKLQTGDKRYASIELKLGHKRVYAYLRYSNGGKTVNQYVCHVDQPTRFDNLKQAWAVALERNLLTGVEQESNK